MSVGEYKNYNSNHLYFINPIKIFKYVKINYHLKNKIIICSNAPPPNKIYFKKPDNQKKIRRRREKINKQIKKERKINTPK